MPVANDNRDKHCQDAVIPSCDDIFADWKSPKYWASCLIACGVIIVLLGFSVAMAEDLNQVVMTVKG